MNLRLSLNSHYFCYPLYIHKLLFKIQVYLSPNYKKKNRANDISDGNIILSLNWLICSVFTLQNYISFKPFIDKKSDNNNFIINTKEVMLK